MIRLDNVTKVYPHHAGDICALRDVNLHVRPGEFVAIIGPSGSGKSTLLNCVGTLDAPSEGSVTVDGRPVQDLPEGDLVRLRRQVVGFVFQSACLLPSLTVKENVSLPGMFLNGSVSPEPVEPLLEKVGLQGRASHRPNELSGGEEQRAAIARALSNGPKIILADEPTGHLDSQTSQEIGKLFLDLNQDLGVTILLVTHNEELAQLAHRRFRITDGTLTEID